MNLKTILLPIIMSTTIENNLTPGGVPSAEGITGAETISYYTERMNLLGITEVANSIGLLQNENGKDVIKEGPVFRQSIKDEKDYGIDILVYSLDRLIVNYKPDGSRWSKNYFLTRLKVPIVKDGKTQKYHIPKGQGTYPFFHPSLIKKFEEKEPIDVLFITEGFFKAWKGCMHGLNVIGLSSITHLKEKDSGKIHRDVLRLIDACKVKRVVWLTDGDCLDITSKELKDGVDLYRRPWNFYRSCDNFQSLLLDSNVDIWFFHIDSDNLVSNTLFSPQVDKKISRDDVKGLDDLLCTFPDRIPDIAKDAESFSGPGIYFVKHRITNDIRRIHSYFHLLSVNDFYLFHAQRRPEIAKVEFVFNGTRYKYDDVSGECKVVVPADAKLYFRVGDTYYKFIDKVNEEGVIERGFEKRLKSTIIDDHGKDFCKHIPKYEAFCNVPNHVNYQQVIKNNFNVYFPFEFQPADDTCLEEDCPYIIAFFKHIFGERTIDVKQKQGDPIRTAYYQLALDYVQLLYSNPVHRLPILCLVSRENETGKSTFGDLMKAIFTNNATVVGNSDLADDFNSFWATKLLIMCDETKIDKQAVVEKVKSLTFAKKIGLNAKGKDKIEIPFFGKFMFFTNNEENFIYASEEDLRYWVIKVHHIKEKNPDLLALMVDEIPQFLSFLDKRKLVSPRITRMWFDPEVLRTDALKKVIAQSHSTVKKELKYHLKSMFLDFGVDEILMSCRVIRENFFKNKEENYIERVLKEELSMLPVQWYLYKDAKFETEESALGAALKDGLQELEALGQITRQGKVMRYTYPRMEMKSPEMGKAPERILVRVSETGRPYKFLRKDFIDDEDAEVSADIKYENEIQPTNGVYGHKNEKDEPNGDLPF